MWAHVARIAILREPLRSREPEAMSKYFASARATVRPRRLPSPGCRPPPRSAPVVKISDKLNPYPVDVYAKCEFFNPLSSVKDRLALAIIEDAEKKGASPRAARASDARARVGPRAL